MILIGLLDQIARHRGNIQFIKVQKVMRIDYTYIINLNTPEQEIREKIKQVNWPYNIGYYILPATNGWEVVNEPSKSRFPFKIADWWKIDENQKGSHNKNFYTREVTPGEAGCMLSHYECIVNGYNDGYQNILNI